MLFNSYIFILLFLPLCIIGYFTLNHYKKYTLGQAFLFGMSLWFYGYYNIKQLYVILVSVLINYGIYVLLCRIKIKTRAKLVMTAGVAANIGILLYFKYMDFFIANINTVFKTDIDFLRIALPLGISFFTFQQISFIVDTYRGEVDKYNFLQYACFVTFFPQLIAGPIVTHDELVPQFFNTEKKKPNADNLARGIYIFVFGLAKKVLLADIFGKIVSYGYSRVDRLDSIAAIMVILSYTIQIYFDFSGYCDMAIGIGKMLNIDLPLNFNSPYKSMTITEFWDRWHITLTRFFTKYVYIPLGGNRKGPFRTYLNILIVFLLSGFWHGASWNFVFWGAIHGVFVIITRKFSGVFEKLHPIFNWLLTFIFVNIAWVFFRADTFTQAVTLLKNTAGCKFDSFDSAILTLTNSIEFTEFFDFFLPEAVYSRIITIAYFMVATFLLLGSKNAYEKMQNFRPTAFRMITTVFLLVWSVFSFTGISTFLYFNF